MLVRAYSFLFRQFIEISRLRGCDVTISTYILNLLYTTSSSNDKRGSQQKHDKSEAYTNYAAIQSSDFLRQIYLHRITPKRVAILYQPPSWPSHQHIMNPFPVSFKHSPPFTRIYLTNPTFRCRSRTNTRSSRRCPSSRHRRSILPNAPALLQPRTLFHSRHDR